jgi:CheY-like chemotaxis protein
MNAATRKKVLAYAIPVDLVVVATGIGLIVPGILPLALIALYVAAVALSAWKSGWRSALAAMVLSAILLVALFRHSVQGIDIGWFVAASVLVSVPLWRWGERQRKRKAQVNAPAAPLKVEPVIATPRSVEEIAAAGVFGEGHVAVSEARARAERERIEAERVAKEKKKVEEDFARTREQNEREQNERFERRRAELQSTFDRERVAMKAKFDAARLELEAQRAELQKQLDEERRRPAVIEKHVDEDAIAQRFEHLRAELQQQFERELKTRLDAELAAQRLAIEQDSVREIAKVRSAADERVAAFRAELERVLAQQAAAPPSPTRARTPGPARKSGFFSGFFNRKPAVGESTATRRAAAAAVAESSATRRANETRTAERKPRVLFLESRRATADTAAPRLKQLGIEIVIVERLVDAIDELYRFRPDVLFIDAEMPDFEKAYRAISGQAQSLPLVLTARNASSIPRLNRADVAIRPYDIDEIVEIVRAAAHDPQSLLAKQNHELHDATQTVATHSQTAVPEGRERYDVVCCNCGVAFDAMEADWCRCLTRERTVVCTNCLTCFCKAAPSYKETFWMDAPPRLFERKTAELRRKSLGIAANLPPGQVKRPMVMLVAHDEEIRAIVQRVCANLGYGSVSAANGPDGLDLARLYHPNLILSDAFLPRLDGREMCRRLKEDAAFASTKMVVMTGLYADTQYMSEAVKRFRIDDYLARPVSITDLINLLQRYIEGVLDLPSQENLHALHRKELDRAGEGERGRNTYEVACATCGDMFDAARADWCGCARDNTLVCEHCGKCFCHAPEYRERFWGDAPAMLFERKMIGSMRDGVPAPDPPPSHAKRPLVVLLEEDEAIQLIVRTVVTTLGYRFIASENAQEALALARRYEPDLILLDAWTTKLDGREMCRRIKEEPALARLKAVVMTGRYADQSYREEALSRFKVDDCIAKPLAVSDLLTIVKKYLPQEVQAIQPTSG